MPRAPRFTTASLRDLFRQLTYAPFETKQRLIDAAESLLAEIESDRAYPEDFVTFRITGYRPEMGDAPVMLVGQALIRDLAIFVQEVSKTLDLPARRNGAAAQPLDALAHDLGLSTKTLQRYRRQGLVCHYVRYGPDSILLSCYEDALRRFQEDHPGRIERATSFSRIGDIDEGAIVRAAADHRRNEELTLNEAALRIARRFDRAHETIRGMLRRHDRRSDAPIFGDRGRSRARRREIMHRAWRWGITIPELASRYGRSESTVRRLINQARRDRIRALDLHHVDLPTFALPEAERVILSHATVTGGMDAGPWSVDALELIARARAARALPEESEDALIGAHHLLKKRVADGVSASGRPPGDRTLDAIETDLRWLGAIRFTLVRAGLRTALRTIELNLGRPLDGQKGATIVEMVQLAIQCVTRVVDQLDPTRGQHLERVSAQVIDRALAQRGEPPGVERARARHPAGRIRLSEDAWSPLVPWQPWLGPRPDFRRHVDALEPAERECIERRYGWRDEPPLTMATLGPRMGVGARAARACLARAERQLRTIARESS